MGEDERTVAVDRERKSVSAETTLAQDTDDTEALLELVSRLSQRVADDLQRRQMRGRTVKLKLRLADFTTFTRQKTLTEPVISPEEIAQAATALIRGELRPGRLFRLVGVGVSGFDHEDQEVQQPRLTGFE